MEIFTKRSLTKIAIGSILKISKPLFTNQEGIVWQNAILPPRET